METTQNIAKNEINESLKFSLFAARCLGISFEAHKSKLTRIMKNILFFSSVFFVIMHAISDGVYISLIPLNIENTVPLLHTQGYTILSK